MGELRRVENAIGDRRIPQTHSLHCGVRACDVQKLGAIKVRAVELGAREVDGVKANAIEFLTGEVRCATVYVDPLEATRSNTASFKPRAVGPECGVVDENWRGQWVGTLDEAPALKATVPQYVFTWGTLLYDMRRNRTDRVNLRNSDLRRLVVRKRPIETL